MSLFGYHFSFVLMFQLFKDKIWRILCKKGRISGPENALNPQDMPERHYNIYIYIHTHTQVLSINCFLVIFDNTDSWQQSYVVSYHTSVCNLLYHTPQFTTCTYVLVVTVYQYQAQVMMVNNHDIYTCACTRSYSTKLHSYYYILPYSCYLVCFFTFTIVCLIYIN